MTKKRLTAFTIFLSILLLASLLLRFYRFPSLLNFSQEQALALNLSADMIASQKIALIGQPYFTRLTPTGMTYHTSGAYLYPLAFMQLIFGYHPLPVTFLYLVINILSVVFLYLGLRRLFNTKVALLSSVIFSLFPPVLYYARVVWNVPLLLPLSSLTILIFSYFKKSKYQLLLTLTLGFISGLGFGFHLSFVLVSFIMLVFLLRQKRPLLLFPFMAGNLIGLSPLVLFELRHNFFNTRVFLEFLTTAGKGTSPNGFGFVDYHFHCLLPFAAAIVGLLIARLPKVLIVIFLFCFVYFAVPFSELNSDTAHGMPMGLNLPTLDHVAALIAADNPPPSYQVASLLSGHTRADPLRYLLQYVHQKPPLNNLIYAPADAIYVLHYESADPTEYNVFELTEVAPLTLKNSWKINDTIYLSSYATHQ